MPSFFCARAFRGKPGNSEPVIRCDPQTKQGRDELATISGHKARRLSPAGQRLSSPAGGEAEEKVRGSAEAVLIAHFAGPRFLGCRFTEAN
jgi:hypothetical protein